MALVTGKDAICKEICDSLGLKHVRRLDLHMAFDEIVTVTVEYYPEIYGIKQLPAILKRFELVEIPDPEKIKETTTIGDEIRTYQEK